MFRVAWGRAVSRRACRQWTWRGRWAGSQEARSQRLNQSPTCLCVSQCQAAGQDAASPLPVPLPDYTLQSEDSKLSRPVSSRVTRWAIDRQVAKADDASPIEYWWSWAPETTKGRGGGSLVLDGNQWRRGRRHPPPLNFWAVGKSSSCQKFFVEKCKLWSWKTLGEI